MEEEFREFVAARSSALLRTAYLLAGDWATAEDLLQTALTKTYLAWKRLGGIEAVEPYARRVLINTATSWWRRRWHGERPTEVLPEQPGPDRHEQALERDLLWRHVRALPARQRAVLVLRFYEDLSEAQTADLLEISPGTVKSQTARALATLRRRLAAEGVVRPAAATPAPVAPTPARPVPAEPVPAEPVPVRAARAAQSPAGSSGPLAGPPAGPPSGPAAPATPGSPVPLPAAHGPAGMRGSGASA
ncbi:MAG: SigE family RNA polymerase sigma factor [Micromonosporaceae bacterium]|nr:SigE family RNA polymerase sigma factor [Micromonosporaceae bacterium]